MPYRWTSTASDPVQTMRIWPHESLPARGMAAFVLTTFTMILIPVIPVLGSPILWGLLPFLLLAVWGVYFALQSNHRARQILEVLSLTDDTAKLVRTNPKGDVQEWTCNRYWTRVEKYEKDGPVPQYITLRGSGREVEIGAFLSEEERCALYDDLVSAFREPAAEPPSTN